MTTALHLLALCEQRGIHCYLDDTFQPRTQAAPGAIDPALRSALREKREAIRAALYLRQLEAAGRWGFGDMDLFMAAQDGAAEVTETGED